MSKKFPAASLLKLYQLLPIIANGPLSKPNRIFRGANGPLPNGDDLQVVPPSVRRCIHTGCSPNASHYQPIRGADLGAQPLLRARVWA